MARTPYERVVEPLRYFAHDKLTGAVLLLLAAAVALVWANSPWAATYHELLDTRFTIRFGEGADAVGLSKPVILWINDGLMGIFFFVVGLEIKREVIAGELRSLRKAALPVAGALGGMVVPALLYVAFVENGAAERGWGVPMATDIAFALGVLALVGNRVPLGLKVFLTALAIVDDIGAILVIAVFYTDQIAFSSLLVGGALFGVSVAANVLGVRNSVVYFLIGTCVWVAFLQSGVHATLAAVLMATTIPARTRITGPAFVARMHELLERLRRSPLPDRPTLLSTEQQEVLHEVEHISARWSAPVQVLEYNLMPFVTLLVLPLFALANAGVAIDGGTAAVFQPVTAAVFLGLFVGKQLGIMGCAWIAVRLGIADLPAGVRWRDLHAVSVLGGVGFTMALFVAALAFDDPALQDHAKIGILLGSAASAVVGFLLLWLQNGARNGAAAPQDVEAPVSGPAG